MCTDVSMYLYRHKTLLVGVGINNLFGFRAFRLFINSLKCFCHISAFSLKWFALFLHIWREYLIISWGWKIKFKETYSNEWIMIGLELKQIVDRKYLIPTFFDVHSVRSEPLNLVIFTPSLTVSDMTNFVSHGQGHGGQAACASYPQRPCNLQTAVVHPHHLP